MLTTRERSALPKRVWLVLADGVLPPSIVGAFRTKREAMAAVSLRRLSLNEMFVIGPYVLQWKKP